MLLGDNHRPHTRRRIRIYGTPAVELKPPKPTVKNKAIVVGLGKRRKHVQKATDANITAKCN